MSISSNSLFQFTNSIEIVEKILSDKFYGSYCKETFHYNKEKITLIIPMICFCDIPLGTVAQYSKYGNYGLGLTKEWGIKNKLNPVLYIERNSMVAESLVKALYGSMRMFELAQPRINELTKKVAELTQNKTMSSSLKTIALINVKNELKKLEEASSPMQHIIYSLYFSKHYADDLERDGQVTKDYRFYDEREWRFLPEFTCAVCELRRSEEDYAVWRGTSQQKPLLSEVSLSFSANDIDHIIVSEDKEVPKIRENILSFPNYNSTEKQALVDKIISFEKIKNLQK